MDYGPSDSSGTDDDLPPLYQGRAGVRINGKPASSGGLPFNRFQNDMESQIHLLEKDAYYSVLQAFRAQSDALSWEKAGLITALRKELRVSDDEHRELLNRVNADDTVRRIRELKEAGAVHSGVPNNIHHSQDQLHSPSVSASRKKQKTGQSAFGTPTQPLPYAAKGDALSSGSRGRKSKVGHTSPVSERGQAVSVDPLVGRKVLVRWPDDNNFYDAVITDYNSSEGLHALVYDINSGNESWEWVNLAEIPAEDICLGGEHPGFPRSGRGGSERGLKKRMGRGGGLSGGRRRGGFKNINRSSFQPLQNGASGGLSDEIKILSTDNLIKEVERIFSSDTSDPYMMEKAKQTLIYHEQSLMDILARLADASSGDGESDEQEDQSSDKRKGLRCEQEQVHEDEDEMVEI